MQKAPCRRRRAGRGKRILCHSTGAHPSRSFARNTSACIASDLTIPNVKFPGKVARGRGSGVHRAGADRKGSRAGGRLFWLESKKLRRPEWELNGNPPLPSHPLLFSIYLLAPALPRPPQPTLGWANRCSAFQALSQVSADLAAPRNGARGPAAAARVLPHSALLKAPVRGAALARAALGSGERRARARHVEPS